MKRERIGFFGKIIFILGLATALFHLYTGAFGTFIPAIQRSIHLGFALVLAFLIYPGTKKSPKNRPSIFDIAIVLVVIGFTIFYVYYGSWIMERIWFVTRLSRMHIVMGVVIILIIIESVRRTLGYALMVVVILSLAYALFGENLPGVLGHPGYNVRQVVDYLVYTDQGVFGLPLGVSATFIALFVVLGGVMSKVGISDFFRDISVKVSARTVGGPGKISVIFSALLGMTTGSSAANVYGSGNFTIPLMKKNGYPAAEAGAIEATASCGGQIMPPIMGAGAFLMAEFLGISYSEIMLRAIIPAILYFVALFFTIHFTSLKLGMTKPVDISVRKGLLKEIYLLAPLFVLVWALLYGFSSMRAAYYGVLAALIVGFVKFLSDNYASSEIREEIDKVKLKDIVEGIYLGGAWLITMAIACAAAGFVVGVLAMTGLGSAFVGILTRLAGDHMFFVAFFVMLASILLGMGIPTTTAYILAAAFAAPALVRIGTAPIVAHFFVFFYGVFANITPPVAVATFAAAAIAQTSIMSTAVKALKIGLIALIIPYMFLYNPVLLGFGGPAAILGYTILGIIGVIFYSAGMAGWFTKKINLVGRLVLIVGGILVVFPKITFSVIGFALLLSYFFYYYVLDKYVLGKIVKKSEG